MTTQQRSQNRAQDLYRFQANDDGQRMKPKFDPDEARSAALTVAAHATDVEDARELLAMCGLLPEELAGPADDRRTLGWKTP